MDKIRRSLSFRRKKKSSDNRLKYQQDAATQSLKSERQLTGGSGCIKSNSSNQISSNILTTIAPGAAPSTASIDATNCNDILTNKPQLWIEDEKRVRNSNCNFQVKYLGSVEVTDSRGMHICELAIEKLLMVNII
jgi:hypothetical protein